MSNEQAAGARPAPLTAGGSSLFEPGRNCWRIERARRTSVVVDGETYFGAVRACCIAAHRFVAICAWDIHSRLDLVRDPPGDGLPTLLSDLLMTLLERKPELQVFVLLWRHAPIYALEREPALFGDHPWPEHPRLHFVRDSSHPFAASQHQKIVVVDGKIAFCGGMDLSKWRWDTNAHDPDDPRRRDPSGEPYPPYHDLHMLVDGDAARALMDQFAARWRWAGAEGLDWEPASGSQRPNTVAGADTGGDADDPWPEQVEVMLRDQPVAIARTLPEFDGRDEIREIEQLYLDTLERAERLLYIENQYLTSRIIGDALCESLTRDQGPDIVIVVPRETGHWFEQHTMDILRARLLKRLRDADVHGRLRVFYPDVQGLQQGCMMIHAKLMIADDRLLRVASSNLSNRSMGLDSECDVCVVVETDEDVAAVRAFRHRLLGMLLSVPPEDVAYAEAQAADRGHGLIAAVEAIRAAVSQAEPDAASGAVRLADLEDRADPEWDRQLPDERLIDPDRPLQSELIAELAVGGDEHTPHLQRRLIVGIGLVLVLVAMAVAWRWTPVGDWLEPDRLAASVEGLSRTFWGPPVALLGFVAASLVAVPVTLLILVTALVFGSITGASVALIGSALSALAGYGIGAYISRDAVERLSGERFDRLSRRLAKRGILAIITVRIVPVAPFAVLNLFAGAVHFRLRDFLIGTVIGMAPAVIAMTVFAEGLLSLIRQADLRAIALIFVGVLALGGLAWLSRRWLRAGDQAR